MAKTNKNFYIAKGSKDPHTWLYYGEEPPIIIKDRTCSTNHCILVGSFSDNPLGDSIENNTIIKIYIRKEKK